MSIVSSYRIHKPSSYQEVPWRNGRGTTLQLLSKPIRESAEFAWRLSIAGVDSDGPFSHFDDCDRVLVLLDGRGVTLTHGNDRVDVLRRRYAQARFPGDVGTVAALHNGPIRDFNVIWNRRYCTAEVAVLQEASNELQSGDLQLVYAVDGDVSLRPPSGPLLRIAHRQLLQCDESPAGRCVISGGPAIAIRIRHHRTGDLPHPPQKS